MAIIRLSDFDNIYNETYQTMLKFIIGKCQNLEDVNELLQDSYIELYHTLDRKKVLKIEDVSAYLKGISKNVIKKFYRKKYREREKVVYYIYRTLKELKEVFGKEEQDYD